MSTAFVTGLFGLGGVALGGVMAMVSARWQAASARQGRIAELELQLKHERLLRDETAKRSAILEFIAALERLNRAVFAIAINHDHGEEVTTWPTAGCSLIDMKEFVAAGISVYDLMQRQGALITWPPDLDTIKELWEYIYLIEDTGYFTLDYYEDGQVNKDVFCEIGGKIACLEFPTQNSIKFLRTELSKISAN